MKRLIATVMLAACLGCREETSSYQSVESAGTVTHRALTDVTLKLDLATNVIVTVPPGYALVCDLSNNVYSWKHPSGVVAGSIVQSKQAAINDAWRYYEWLQKPKKPEPKYDWQDCDAPATATSTPTPTTNHVVPVTIPETPEELEKFLQERQKRYEERDLNTYKKGAHSGAILAFRFLTEARGAYGNSEELESDVELVMDRLILAIATTNLPNVMTNLFEGTRADYYISTNR